MTAWVIGGTSGIGSAIAEHLRDIGGDVFVTGIDVDVTSYDALQNYANHILSNIHDGEPLEQVYFCAGDNYLEWLGMLGPQGAANQIGLLETNVGGFINLMDVLVRLWNEHDNVGMPGHQKSGVKRGMRVCAISSDAAERPMRTSIGYCASKAALNMAIRVAARELGPRGWEVLGVAPGMIDGDTQHGSAMTNYIDERVPQIRDFQNGPHGYEVQQAVIKHPLRIHPVTVANFAIDLMLSHGPHVNGNIFTLNGGR